MKRTILAVGFFGYLTLLIPVWIGFDLHQLQGTPLETSVVSTTYGRSVFAFLISSVPLLIDTVLDFFHRFASKKTNSYLLGRFLYSLICFLFSLQLAFTNTRPDMLLFTHNPVLSYLISLYGLRIGSTCALMYTLACISPYITGVLLPLIITLFTTTFCCIRFYYIVYHELSWRLGTLLTLLSITLIFSIYSYWLILMYKRRKSLMLEDYSAGMYMFAFLLTFGGSVKNIYEHLTCIHHLHNSDILYSTVSDISLTAIMYVLSTIMMTIVPGRMARLEASNYLKTIMDTKKSYVRYISHELRTPINAISMGINLCMDDEDDKDNDCNDDIDTLRLSAAHKQDILKDTSVACHAAIDILNDLLLYDKVENDMMVLNKTKVPIAELVNDSLKMFNIQYRQKKIELVIENGIRSKDKTSVTNLISHSESSSAEDPSPSISISKESPMRTESCTSAARDIYGNSMITEDDILKVDKAKMIQVIRNVMSNALKFTPEGGQIYVSMKYEDFSDSSAKCSSNYLFTACSSAKSDCLTSTMVPFLSIVWSRLFTWCYCVNKCIQALLLKFKVKQISSDHSRHNYIDHDYNSNKNQNIEELGDKVDGYSDKFRHLTIEKELIQEIEDDDDDDDDSTCIDNQVHNHIDIETGNNAYRNTSKISGKYRNTDQSNKTTSAMMSTRNSTTNSIMNNTTTEYHSSHKYKPTGHFVMTIRDTGAGISKENQSQLFHNIIQFKPEVLQQGGGSGLGLYISKSIVDKHHGTIDVYSAGEGQGTTFTIKLPMSRFNRSKCTSHSEHMNDLILSSLSPSSYLSTTITNTTPTTNSVKQDEQYIQNKVCDMLNDSELNIMVRPSLMISNNNTTTSIVSHSNTIERTNPSPTIISTSNHLTKVKNPAAASIPLQGTCTCTLNDDSDRCVETKSDEECESYLHKQVYIGSNKGITIRRYADTLNNNMPTSLATCINDNNPSTPHRDVSHSLQNNNIDDYHIEHIDVPSYDLTYESVNDSPSYRCHSNKLSQPTQLSILIDTVTSSKHSHHDNTVLSSTYSDPSIPSNDMYVTLESLSYKHRMKQVNIPLPPPRSTWSLSTMTISPRAAVISTEGLLYHPNNDLERKCSLLSAHTSADIDISSLNYHHLAPSLTKNNDLVRNDCTSTDYCHHVDIGIENHTINLPELIPDKAMDYCIALNDDDLMGCPVTPKTPDIEPLVKSSKSLHVLIVDDSSMNRKMMARLLSSVHYTYIEAGDGVEAVQIMTQSMKRHPDVPQYKVSTTSANSTTSTTIVDQVLSSKSNRSINSFSMITTMLKRSLSNQLTVIEKNEMNSNMYTLSDKGRALSPITTKTDGSENIQNLHTITPCTTPVIDTKKEAFLAKPYDVILMDFMMPNMDGPTATAEIRKLGYTGLIYGVTGNAQQFDIDHFIEKGANKVFIKPLVITDFIKEIQ